MQLQELPADLLRRVLCVACTTPRELLACGAVSHALRCAVGAPRHRDARDALTALWMEVMAMVDPAAGLLPRGALTGAQARDALRLAVGHQLRKHAFYERFSSTHDSILASFRGERREGEADAQRALQAARDAEVAAAAALPEPPEVRAALLYGAHALAAGRAACRADGWFALAHALLERACCTCGDVTRFIRWSYDLDTFLTALDDDGAASFLNPDAVDADADAADAAAADADEDGILGPVRMCAMCSGELDSDEDEEEQPLADVLKL